MMDKPVFIDINAQQIIDDTVTAYETATGKVLAPGQAERLLINAFAYREYLLRTAIQSAAEQNLVDFAVYPALDWLGVLVGVSRLSAVASECTIKLNLVDGHSAISIPSGIRIQSIDGQAIFATTETINVPVGVNSIVVNAQSLAEGIVGNGYAIGQVSVILDPQPYLTGATNVDVTNGGSVEETDDALRERIKLAPSSFSNAGSKGAYKYWAKTAHPLIMDVSVASPVPGTVVLYPLLQGGVIPSTEIIDAVYATCNADKVRPLTDTVIVESPEAINYDLNIELTLLTNAVQSDVVNAVDTALQAYADDRKQRMGVDVVISQLIRICNIDGVYSTKVVSPSADIVVNDGQFANIGTINVTVTGTSDE